MSAARIETALEITIAGRLRLCDRLLLDGDVVARMRRFDALATCVLLGPRAVDLSAAALVRVPIRACGTALG